MAKENQELSRSRALAAKVNYAALQVLKENGGSLPSKAVLEEVEKKIELDAYAKERYEKSNYIRWQSILHLFSIDFVKAGFLIKKKGNWYITPEGEAALKLGEVNLLKAAMKAYREWKGRQKEESEDLHEGEDEEVSTLDASATVNQVEELAKESIKQFILKKNPYEFQDLVAALLRGMGYYTPFVAPKGKDGGVDVIAYRDPFGTESPRIKVQVKHRDSSATVQEVRQLMGILQKDGDVGIFVSTGGFTADAKSTAVGAHIHVELIDMEAFIGLWQEFYKKLSDEDKNLMPLVPVYFLAPTE